MSIPGTPTIPVVSTIHQATIMAKVAPIEVIAEIRSLIIVQQVTDFGIGLTLEVDNLLLNVIDLAPIGPHLVRLSVMTIGVRLSFRFQSLQLLPERQAFIMAIKHDFLGCL
jgi:hypothetical protein